MFLLLQDVFSVKRAQFLIQLDRNIKQVFSLFSKCFLDRNKKMEIGTLRAIGQLLNFCECDLNVATPIQMRIVRIYQKLTTKVGDIGFEDDVLLAEKAVSEEGGRAIMQTLFQLIAPPPERQYKIKRVAKGQRIDVKSASGVRFSFGPAWVTSVMAAKGIAVNEANREKLNMHGTHLGIPVPDTMSARELCAAISATLAEEEQESQD